MDSLGEVLSATTAGRGNPWSNGEKSGELSVWRPTLAIRFSTRVLRWCCGVHLTLTSDSSNEDRGFS